MSSTMVFFIFIPLLSLILLTINIIFAPHNPYIEKNNAFECGFTSFIGQNRIQFSISFFIFALLFLLFDLEILLVYPYLMSAYINEAYGLLILMAFLGVLTIGFIFELGKKALTIDSRQSVLSNYNLIKKSLSKIPYTTIFANSMLFKSLFMRGSVLLNKNLKNIHVKYVNLHTSLSLYKKHKKNIFYTVISNATNGKSNYYTDSVSVKKSYNNNIISNPQLDNNLTQTTLTKKNFCLPSMPRLANISLSKIYNQKRSFSTTNTLNGLGILEEIEHVRSRRDALRSHILKDQDEDYYYTEHSRIKEINDPIRNRSKGGEKRWLESIERYFEQKVKAIQVVDRDHADQLFVLSSNHLIDNKLPSIKNNRDPVSSPIREVKHLAFVRERLDEPLRPKPMGWRADRCTENNLDDSAFGIVKLCPPYQDTFVIPEYQCITHDDTNNEPLIMQKPQLINRDLDGNPISKPLEPVQMPVVREEKYVNFGQNTNLTGNNGVSLTHSRSTPLESYESVSSLGSNMSSGSAMCLVSLGEFNPCLRFLFLFTSIIKTNCHKGYFYILIYKLKNILVSSANEIIKIIRVAIVFITKNPNANLNSNPNPSPNGSNYNKIDDAHSSYDPNDFYHQLHNNNLIMHSSIFSSLFNVKFLFTKTFLYNYIYTLKDKFNYKWVISMVLAILFTYIFRNILIYRLDSLGIDLTSITGISISISSISVFFRSILHLIECAISYETAKMPMGPNDLGDVKLPKNSIDANTVLKKDGVDTEMKNESKSDANKKLSLQNLPCDIRKDIAECAGADLKGMRRLVKSGDLSLDKLDANMGVSLMTWKRIGREIVHVDTTHTSVWGIKFIPDHVRKHYEDLIAYRRKLNYMVEVRTILVPEKDFDPNSVQKCEERADALIERFHNLAKDAVWEKDAQQRAINPSTVPTIGDRYKKEISENTKVFTDKPK